MKHEASDRALERADAGAPGMSSLIVMMDEAAPSFCYYDVPQGRAPRRIDEPTFELVMRFARERQLGLQLLCGPDGLPAFASRRLCEHPFTCTFPAGAPFSESSDVPVVDADEPGSLEAIPCDVHGIAVMRIRQADVPRLPELWEALAERVYRVVLVVLDLPSWSDEALDRYRTALTDVRQRLAAKYLRGDALELNVLSDRLALFEPSECGAGIDHLTVTPEGALHLCPGFALSGAPPVGHVSAGWSIPNEHLLHREHSPICSVCDAFHCRRCVYMNQRATLELNTPASQVCRTAHVEREVSRRMLAYLHERRCLENLPPIAPLDYDDPLHVVLEGKFGARRTHARPRHGTPPVEGGSHTSPATPSVAEARCSDGAVGRVSAADRDRIRELYLRRQGLAALFTTLAKMDAETLESSPLYDRIVRDMGVVTVEFDAWWEAMAAKYAWRRDHPDQSWRVDFESCDVYLETSGASS